MVIFQHYLLSHQRSGGVIRSQRVISLTLIGPRSLIAWLQRHLINTPLTPSSSSYSEQDSFPLNKPLIPPCADLKVLQIFLEIPCFIFSLMPFVLCQMFCEGFLQFFFDFKAIQRCSCRLRCSEPIVGGSAGQHPPDRFVNLLEIIHSVLLHLHMSFLNLILKLIILSQNLISLLKFGGKNGTAIESL